MTKRGVRAIVTGGALVLLIGGCASILGIPSDVERDDGTLPDGAPGDENIPPENDGDPGDATIDVVLPDGAPPLLCDPLKPFQAPVKLEPPSANTTFEGSPRLSESELTMYFDGIRAPSGPLYTLLQATRSALDQPFGPTTRVPGVVDRPDAHEYSPNITADGLTLVFERQLPGSPVSEINIATRTLPDGGFNGGTPVNIAGTTGYEANPFIRGSANEIWFVATGPDTTIDVYRATRQGAQYNATAVAEINSDSGDYTPVISFDGRTIYFASDRPGGSGGLDIWSATRPAANGTFGKPSIVPNVNSPDNDAPGWVSADGCRLYISRQGVGTQDIWVATRPK